MIAILLCFLTASVCLHAAAWAEGPPPGSNPPQDIWNSPKEITPPATGVAGGASQLDSTDDIKIKAILLDIARRTKALADLAVDKTDDALTPIKPAGEIASHGGGGQALDEWTKYWTNLSNGLDINGRRIPRNQWRSMFKEDKLKQWQQYRDWFAAQADKLQKLGTAISIVDSGSKVAGALWEGEGKLAAVTLADEVCKTGAVTFGALFGAPWGPGGAIAGAYSGEELWRKFGSPKFEQRAQFIKNMEVWNEKAGDRVRMKFGSFPEFDAFMQGKISEVEFTAKVHEYRDQYKKEMAAKKRQHEKELELLRSQAEKEPELQQIIDTWQAGKLPKSQKPALVEALRRAIRAQKGPSAKAGDEFECKLDEAPPAVPSASTKDVGSLGKDEIDALNNDLCRCSCNPTVGGGAKYDPASGCVCLLNLGGSFTIPMASSGECFDKTVSAAGVDPKKLAEKINKDNYELYKKYIAEARRIIEEYLIVTPSLFQKKSEQGGSEGEKGYILLAANFSENSPMGEILYAASAAKGAPASYAEMVKEKNRRGDPDRALSLVKTAETFMPDRKASGETTNILAEFAVMMSKASLNIVTDLEFDDGLYLLHKAAEFYKAGESNALGQEIMRLTSAFQQWKKDWEVLQREIPNCLTLIENKKVCECERLNSDKITPASNSFTVYGHASSQKWEISAASGQPRAIPKKEKLTADLKLKLPAAIQKCASHPAMKTNEMSQLSGFEQYKFLEKSPYMNKEDFRKSSALPISDEQAVKNAEKLLGVSGLCDCERDKIKGILETAKKDIKYSKLEVDLTANKKSLKLGEYVRVHLSIRSGRKPYSYTITGDMVASERMTQSPGLITEYPPKTAGKKIVKAVVTDAAGDSRTVTVSFDVRPPKEVLSSTGSGGRSSPSPVYDPTRDINYKDYKDKPVDITSVNKAGKDFQEKSLGNKKIDEKGEESQITAQPDAYTGNGSKKPDEGKEHEPARPPHTIYDHDNSRGVSEKDWTDWATKGASKATVQTSNASGSTSKGTGASSSGSSTDGAGSTSQGTTQPVPKPAGSPPKLGIYLTLENKSQSPVHIFIDGFGEKMNPDNRIDPGGSRTLHSTLNAFEVVFVAGRNGQALTSTKWIPPAGTSNADLKVVFTLNEKLEVQQTR